jgi:hypothetical protein
MFEISSDWFSPGFEPHGHCFVDPLLWLYVASGSWIACLYHMIPIALASYVRNRRDLAFYWMFLMFSGFIFACGTTPRLGIWKV